MHDVKKKIARVCGVPGDLCRQQVMIRFRCSGEGGWPDYTEAAGIVTYLTGGKGIRLVSCPCMCLSCTADCSV